MERSPWVASFCMMKDKKQTHPAEWMGLKALITKTVPQALVPGDQFTIRFVACAGFKIIEVFVIFRFHVFFMAIEAELCGFELAYDIDLSFLWNFAFHIQAPEGCVYQ